MDNDVTEAAPVITATVHSFAPLQVVEVHVDDGAPHWVPVLGMVSADEAKAQAIDLVQGRYKTPDAVSAPSSDYGALLDEIDELQARVAVLEKEMAALKAAWAVISPMVSDVALPSGMLESATATANPPPPATDPPDVEGTQTAAQPGTPDQAGA